MVGGEGQCDVESGIAGVEHVYKAKTSEIIKETYMVLDVGKTKRTVKATGR